MLWHGSTFFLLFAVLLIGLLALLIAGPFIWPLLLRGAPFVPSSRQRVDAMIALARLGPDDAVADLGSGEGCLARAAVRAAVRAGAREAVGYEIQPALVWWSRLRSMRQPNARFLFRPFWHADLRGTTVVFLYQLPATVARLSAKLKAELPPGARVVSNGFVFPDWPPAETRDRVTLYRV